MFLCFHLHLQPRPTVQKSLTSFPKCYSSHSSASLGINEEKSDSVTITPQPWESGETCRKVLFRETPLSQPLTTCLTRCPPDGTSDFRLLTNTTPTTPHCCSATRHHHSGHSYTHSTQIMSIRLLPKTLQPVLLMCVFLLFVSFCSCCLIFMFYTCRVGVEHPQFLCISTMAIKGYSILV